MDTRFNLNSSVMRGAFAREPSRRRSTRSPNGRSSRRTDEYDTPRRTYAYVEPRRTHVYDAPRRTEAWPDAHYAPWGWHLPFGPPSTPRNYFGGTVPLSSMDLTPEAQVRVMMLQERYLLVHALGNGDCGYNAFLGCMLWTMAGKSDESLDTVYALFAILVPEAHVVGHRHGDLFRARRGHATLLQFIAALSGATRRERTERLDDFCESGRFEEAVGFLRYCTARQQLDEAPVRDGAAVWRHVDRSTTVAGSFASWFELRALAEVLRVDLTVANPIESDDACVYTCDDAWGRLALLCWAEHEQGAGHFDGLLPRY